MSLLRSIWRSTNFKALILFVLNYDCVCFTSSPKNEQVARYKREYGNEIFIRGWRVLHIRLEPLLPPPLILLVPKTVLKKLNSKFLLLKTCRRYLEHKVVSKVPVGNFSLQSAQQWASVNSEIVCPRNKGFSFSQNPSCEAHYEAMSHGGQNKSGLHWWQIKSPCNV